MEISKQRLEELIASAVRDALKSAAIDDREPPIGDLVGSKTLKLAELVKAGQLSPHPTTEERRAFVAKWNGDSLAYADNDVMSDLRKRLEAKAPGASLRTDYARGGHVTVHLYCHGKKGNGKADKLEYIAYGPTEEAAFWTLLSAPPKRGDA